MLEDKLLVLRCKSGSKPAMSRIYEKYKDYLLTIAMALLNEKNSAEDVVHDVFICFVQSLESFSLTGSLKGYLAACTANLARDRLRSLSRQTKSLDLAEPTASDAFRTEDCLLEKEVRLRLKSAISQLPYEQREVIVLHLNAGLKFREIACLKKEPVSTIHSRYSYGLDKLRTLLNSEFKK